jgi:transcriptional regulator with XRE-family HTH domain
VGETLAQQFGENLRTARLDRHLSQTAVAQGSGISSTEVSRLESGKREPRLATIIALARALEVDGGDLIRGLS